MGRKQKYIIDIRCSKCKRIITKLPEERDQSVVHSYQTICNRCVNDMELRLTKHRSKNDKI